MHVVILGAAAGGGLPQWNANGPMNERARANDPDCPPQTQSSIAVSADGERFVVFNASPDMRAQLNATPQLHPRLGERRHTPIAGIVLTNADVDHIAGLLTVRERQAFDLFASSRVLDALGANPVFNVLNPDFVTRNQVTLNQSFECAGLTITLFAVPGKVALFLEKEGEAGFGTADGDTVGALIEAGGKTLAYIPGCAAVPDDLKTCVAGADCLLFDGTLYTDDEMVAGKESPKTGARMGHISISGDDGAIAAWDGVTLGRKLFIHLNNTNPVWLKTSAERKAVEAAGWGVCHDGMEITL